MKKIILAAALISSTLFSVESDYEISAMVGSNDFNSETLNGADRRSDRTAHLGFKFNNFTIQPQLALEYVENGPRNIGTGDIWKLALNGVYEKGQDLKGYVLAGLGYEDLENETDGTNLESGVFANVGAGLKYPIYKALQVQLEGKILQRFDGTDRVGREYMLLGGLNLALGNVRVSEKKEVVVAPVAVAPVIVVPVSIDSDNDGVANSADLCPNTKVGLSVNSDGCSLYQLDTDGDGVVDSFDRCPETPVGLNVNSIGCQNDFKPINFFFNTPNIARGDANVERLISYLKANTQYRVELVGHTDNVDNYAVNQALSERRAEKIRTLLVNRGISNSRIVTLGLGETSPVVSNDTPEHRLQNRRVEITIIK
ncbi:MAG: Unknown protein [uncultured Campylobacterales bacterium]|uniref:OmpA-like domain-containing protein n=1 Tax=uncultured Campylobacterales bacterium TaxID=352960 RepID=A0A6S6SP29_9BACT|nr:MAG: Unknown protein [uncultured Campylobacterales bacterium]